MQIMALRRAAMLILGLAGSALVMTVLFCSVTGRLILCQPIPTDPVDAWKPNVEEPSNLQEGMASCPKELSFPVLIPDTTLFAEEVVVYDGVFLENGSDKEVVGIAALRVMNFGSREIAKAQIELFAENMRLVFYGEHIPAGASVLLLEKNAQPYRQTHFAFCTGWQQYFLDDRTNEGYLSVEDRAMGTVAVTNITDTALENIHLFYKSWLSSHDLYIGGITHSVYIPQLQPGATEYLYPPFYASGYSKVVSVKVGPLA